MRTPIHLPVLDRLQVTEYPLYPGSARKGLDLAFSPGVTVIAGVNGIGKTTLLNLALRMLLGASSPSKAATRDIGRASRRSLVNTKKFKFFAARVPNLPAAASATLSFHIGATKVVIQRSLVDLSIVKLEVGSESSKDVTNAQFLDKMATLSGLSSAYDYHMVVRYVQFFTEERLPLLWSATAQIELFKMLFAEATNMNSLNALYKEIQKVDSDLRNRVYQLNDRKEVHAKVMSAVGLGDVGVEQIREIVAETNQLREQAQKELAFGNRAVREVLAKQDTERRELEDLQNQLDQKTHEFHRGDAAFIAQILPVPHKDKMALLVQGLTSNLGCFVCGRAGNDELGKINQRISDHHCFVCDGKLPMPDSHGPTPAADELRALEVGIDELVEEIERRQIAQERTAEEYLEAVNAVRPIASRHNELVHKLEQIALEWPNEVMAADGADPSEIASEEAAIEQLRLKRNQLNQDYRAQIAELSTRMGVFEKDLGQRLTTYAEAFLLEKVAVEFSRNAAVKIVTGVVPVKVPTFRISMTSSTHLATHERGESTSVSESQKEFLDLAFRMTLLDMIGADTGTMLIMETPEASLDSWFMERAAVMIRKFAPATGRTKLIATSNVNGTTMIPDLLGLKNGARLAVKDKGRLINLLALAAEPGVLKDAKAKAALLGEMREYADA
ncbi:AAA family ATPase [Stenotrophomonas maltophilia]|uniref:AAA family ATPase n=1 Tax=Stenotrophomonas maltophilia TaxID=40324 RepID=UPI0039C28872